MSHLFRKAEEGSETWIGVGASLQNFVVTHLNLLGLEDGRQNLSHHMQWLSSLIYQTEAVYATFLREMELFNVLEL